MLRFETTSLEYFRSWNEDLKQSMEMSGGLLCSLRNVRQDRLHQQQLHLLAATAITAAGGADEGAEALERALLQPAFVMTNPATLMPNPRSLFALWNEY
jgi:hypothetical protein